MQFHLECPLTFAKYTKELRLVVISSLKWKLRHPRGLKAMNLYRSELMEWKDSFNYFFLSHFMPFPWYIISVISFYVVIVASFTWLFSLSPLRVKFAFIIDLSSQQIAPLPPQSQLLLDAFSCRERCCFLSS